jgi:hypothetical protein
MKTCNNCKNGKTKFSDLVWNKKEIDGFVMTNKKLFYVKCELGHNDIIKDWWENNGHKKSDDICDELACFEPTEFSVITDNLIDKLDELLNELKK